MHGVVEVQGGRVQGAHAPGEGEAAGKEAGGRDDALRKREEKDVSVSVRFSVPCFL